MSVNLYLSLGEKWLEPRKDSCWEINLLWLLYNLLFYLLSYLFYYLTVLYFWTEGLVNIWYCQYNDTYVNQLPSFFVGTPYSTEKTSPSGLNLRIWVIGLNGISSYLKIFILGSQNRYTNEKNTIWRNVQRNTSNPLNSVINVR